MKRVYLAGPMSGLPGFNYPLFNRVAESLRLKGLDVANPAENRAPECGSWEGYMRQGLAMLIGCECVVLLPGWRESRGARLEYHLALDLGLSVVPVSEMGVEV